MSGMKGACGKGGMENVCGKGSWVGTALSMIITYGCDIGNTEHQENEGSRMGLVRFFSLRTRAD